MAAHPASEDHLPLRLVPAVTSSTEAREPETVADLVGAILTRLGATSCFGVVGAGNAELTASLSRYGVRVVHTRTGSGAVTMADAHSRMAGTPALVSVDREHGLTNVTPALAEAARSRTPLVVLAVESGRTDVAAFSAVDQDNLVRSVHATPARVNTAVTAATDIARAWRTAVNERRTVVLTVPHDLLRQPTPPLPTGLTPPAGPARIRPDASMVTRAAQLLADAVRPVFIAGRGARHAETQITRLAEYTGALVATSTAAKGLFNGNDFDLGVAGVMSSPTTAELILDADLIVTFGCSLGPWTTRHGSLLNPAVRVIQVDVEDAALGAHRPVDAGLVGDSAETARALLSSLRNGAAVRDGIRPATTQHLGYHTDEIRNLLGTGDWRRETYTDLSTPDRIDPRTATKALDHILPLQRVVAVDAGNFMGYPVQFLGVPDENGFCFTQAVGAPGLGLATAIGAGLARADRIPVLGTGDGGFHMALAELETAVRLRLPVVCVVYNDAGHGSVTHSHPGQEVCADLPDTDFTAIARGFGAEGITVRCQQDLEQVRDWVDGPMSGPLVIDLKIASDDGAWWLAATTGGPVVEEPAGTGRHRRT